MIQQLPLELGHRAASGATTSWSARATARPSAWIDLWPRWPAPGLVVFGPAASGKSHLAEVWRTRSDAVRLDRAALAPDAIERGVAGAPLSSIEDADRGVDETALFHLYNILAERQGSCC